MFFFGNDRDVAAYIPLHEDQTNSRGELRAALYALEGHRAGERTLICPDCLLVVKGVLGWAQRCRQHNWSNAKGPIWDLQHRDLWEEILKFTEKWGDQGRVQRTIKSSKSMVRTGVFIGQANRYLVNAAPKPGSELIRSQKNTVQTEVFVGQGVRWTQGRTQDLQRSAHPGMHMQQCSALQRSKECTACRMYSVRPLNHLCCRVLDTGGGGG